MREVDNNRIHSVSPYAGTALYSGHKMTRCQVLQSRRKRSYLIYRLSSLTDVIRCLVTFVVYARTHLPCSHCNCQLTPTLALILLQTANNQNVVATSRRGLRDICWSRSDHKSRSLTVDWDCNDHQLVKRSSEWVSEWVRCCHIISVFVLLYLYFCVFFFLFYAAVISE